MVIIMVLLVACALFAIVGGLAFVEGNSMRLELQQKRVDFNKAMDAIDIYRERLEATDKRCKMYIELYDKGFNDWNTKNTECFEYRNKNGLLLNELDILKIRHQSLKASHEHVFNEVKVLRSKFNEHELLKQQHDELKQKYQSIIDTLPDWAGGEDVD
jgi:hypothetical protein